MIPLRQATASQKLPLGPFLDNVDGDTAMTALTIANSDLKLFKAGASSLVNKNSGGGTHMASGIYVVTLDATDTATAGPLYVFSHMSGALEVKQECFVFPAQIYDSVYGGGDALQVDVAQWNNSNIATPDATGCPKVTIKSGTGAGEVNLSSGNLAGSVASVAGAVGSVTGAVGSVTGAVGSVTGNVGGNVVGNVNGNVVGNVVGLDKTGYSLSTLNRDAVAGAVWDVARSAHVAGGSFGQGVASVQGAVTGAVGSVTGAVGSVTGAVGSVTGAVGSVTGNVGGSVAGSVGSVASGGITAASFAADSITASAIAADAIGSSELAATAVNEIADQVWDEVQSGHTTAGTFGKFLDSAVSGVSTGGVSASDIADAVWDEVQAGHTTVGTFGKYLDAAVSGVSTGGVSVADIADAVWDEARAGHVTAGSFGQGVASVQGNVTGSAASVSGAVGSVTGAVGSVTGAVGSVTGNVSGSVASVAAGGITSSSFASAAITAAAIAADAIGASELASDAVTEIVNGVWDASQSAHTTAGTFGKYLDSAVSGVSTGGVSAADIADAVWDEARSGHVVSGSFGQGVASVTGAVGSVTGNVGGNVVGTVASVTGNVDGTVASVVGSVGGNVVGSVGTLTAIGMALMADAVWDETQAGHVGTGTFGKNLDSPVSGVSTGGVSVSDIVNGIWDEARAGHVTSGSFGEAAGTGFNDVVAIKAKTDALPAAPAAVGSPMTLTTAERTSVADALLGRDFAAVSGGSTRSALNALRFLRNRFRIANNILTVYLENDVDPAWTAAVTETVGNPISESDPVG